MTTRLGISTAPICFGEKSSVMPLSKRAPFERLALECGQVDTVEAPHVDRCGRRAIGRRRERERLRAARRAKLVFDRVLVERVGGEIALGRLQRHLVARDEPEKKTFPLAMRA